MPYESESDLKYIDSLSDIPLTGPDAWSDDPSAKLQAAESAESLLESRVNDGDEIPADNVESIHATAANAYASYILLSGVEHPNSAQSGDFYSGSNEDVAEVASEMKNVWEDAVTGITSADADSGDDRDSARASLI